MPIGGRSEYTTAWTNLKGENNIVNLINKYPNDIFQFVILAETEDEKKALTPGGTAPTAVFQFGPESYMTSDMISSSRHKKLLEFQQKFGPIKIATVARDSGRETFNDSGFIAKFEDDGKVTTEFSEISKTNESLPREQTVKQWQKLRKMTKGVDIGDRVSDMNKQGANIQYIQNPVDTGIESYEDFEKKNKSFVPSWNLKGMLSPYRKNKIKRFNEGVWNYQRKADGDLCRQIARDLYYNGHDERGGLYDRQESGEKIQYKEIEELFNNPKELHKEATWDMFETVLSELANDENWDEKVGINFYSEDDDETDEDEIEPGDYVNFNRHGLLYVVSILGDGYLVSKDENQRYEGDNGDGFIIPFDSEGTVIEKGN